MGKDAAAWVNISKSTFINTLAPKVKLAKAWSYGLKKQFVAKSKASFLWLTLAHLLYVKANKRPEQGSSGSKYLDI